MPTTFDAEDYAACEPVREKAPSPDEFHEQLQRAFLEAGKLPAPTRTEAACAFVEVGPHWSEFLDWLRGELPKVEAGEEVDLGEMLRDWSA